MGYLELINSIKNNYDETWVTPSQKLIYDRVTTKLKAQKVINIFGDPGVGKTFLGWLIATFFKGNYAQNTNDLKDNIVNVLDGFGYKKIEFRTLLPQLQMLSIPKTVIISDKMIQDDIISLELKFDQADKEKFKNNLWKFCKLEFAKEKNNMNALIKSNIS